MQLIKDHIEELIQSLLNELFSLFNATAKVGAELEFYLQHQCEDQEKVIHLLQQRCGDIEKEKGWGQFECVVSCDLEVMNIPKEIEDLRYFINFTCRQNQITPRFEAKPFEDDYGSALHLHLSLHGENGQNLFAHGSVDENECIGQVAAGILDIADESMYLLFENEQDFARLDEKYMAPTTISWGGNNRSTLLRIPQSLPENRRLEFRLPSASSDPYLALFVLLLGAYHGLKNKLTPPERIFGNAYDVQYEQRALLKTMEEAKIAFNNGGKILYYVANLIDLPK